MQSEYKEGTFKQHLTICDMHEPLPFKPYLTKVIIDNPNICDTTYFDTAVDEIEKLLLHNEISVSLLEVRQCTEKCNCQKSYGDCEKETISNKFEIKQTTRK